MTIGVDSSQQLVGAIWEVEADIVTLISAYYLCPSLCPSCIQFHKYCTEYRSGIWSYAHVGILSMWTLEVLLSNIYLVKQQSFLNWIADVIDLILQWKSRGGMIFIVHNIDMSDVISDSNGQSPNKHTNAILARDWLWCCYTYLMMSLSYHSYQCIFVVISVQNIIVVLIHCVLCKLLSDFPK